MKKRSGEPWMPADEFGRRLAGAGVNLLVADIGRALAFQRTVLQTTVVYSDDDFAVIDLPPAQWMFHADHTYRDHPLYGVATAAEGRGAGVELRIYHHDPDAAEARAAAHGYTVLAGSMDKPHGLRECYLVDDDGYVWVPSRPI